MDFDSAMIITSFAGLALTSFWTRWLAMVFAKAGGRATAIRIVIVVVLSLIFLGVAHVGPWIVMAAKNGTLAHNLSDPKLPLGMAIMFGPSALLQIALAVHYTRNGV